MESVLVIMIVVVLGITVIIDNLLAKAIDKGLNKFHSRRKG